MLFNKQSKLKVMPLIYMCIGLVVTSNTTMAKNLSNTPNLDIPHKVFKLDNGLTTIVYSNHSSPTVFVGMWYDVGSKDEPEGKTGFAHLFEHLMFKGSEHHKGEYTKPFELAGATGMNGTTGNDQTNYFQNVPTEALDMALWMESERMGYLLGSVDEKALSDEKNIVKNEKGQSDNRPGSLSYIAHLDSFYPKGHPYSHRIIGTDADIRNATLEDVHAWFNKYYGASNATLILSGDITADEAEVLVTKYFAEMPVGEPLSKRQEWIGQLDEVIETITYEKVPQATYDRTYAIPAKGHKDVMLTKLMIKTFANNANSPLHKKLVDELKLATSVEGDIFSQKLTSNVTIRVLLKEGVTLEQIDNVVEDELQKYLKNGPNKLLLKHEKLTYNMELLNKLQYNNGVAFLLTEDYLATGDAGFYKKELEWVNNATTQELQDVANRWLTSGYYAGHTAPFPNYTSTEQTVDRTSVPAIGDPVLFKFPKYTKTTLSNGIKLVHIEDKSLPAVTVGLQFATGTNAENQNSTGVARATFDLFDKGTNKYSKSELSAKLQALGISPRATVGNNSSHLDFFTMDKNLESSMKLSAHMLKNASFKTSQLNTFKAGYLQYVEGLASNPNGNAMNATFIASYEDGSPIARSPNAEQLKSLSREDLIEFYSREVTPNNMTIYLAGNVSLKTAKKISEKTFGSWSAKGQSKLRSPGKVKADKRIILIDDPGSSQSTIITTQKLPSAVNTESQSLFNYLLGGSFTSRLNLNLREDKGWSYGARSRVNHVTKGDNLIMLRAQVQKDKTLESVKEIAKELKLISSSKPISESDFDKAIQNNVRSMNGKFGNTSEILRSMTESSVFNLPLNHAENSSQRYLALKRNEVQKLINDNVDVDNLTWVIIGDLADIEKGIRSLDYDNIEVWDAYGNKVR